MDDNTPLFSCTSGDLFQDPVPQAAAELQWPPWVSITSRCKEQGTLHSVFSSFSAYTRLILNHLFIDHRNKYLLLSGQELNELSDIYLSANIFEMEALNNTDRHGDPFHIIYYSVSLFSCFEPLVNWFTLTLVNCFTGTLCVMVKKVFLHG